MAASFGQSRHPDEAALLDWVHYGPKNSDIWNLVRCLAHQHGMRLAEIEALIDSALRSELKRREDQVRGVSSGVDPRQSIK
ncbi:hypothetical protein F8A10_16415 [Paracoccus kondratievae]|uniref:hypothetical protein n=1 Tax=Paracoccus kondratievae TaxID=135740 RepID=UPI00126641E8|nr:hypothetical protein [Paracoccus kondratievae]QFQ88995.1 hypothetical protein F8A10_16415 [Paracoccus kondratievae]